MQIQKINNQQSFGMRLKLKGKLADAVKEAISGEVTPPKIALLDSVEQLGGRVKALEFELGGKLVKRLRVGVGNDNKLTVAMRYPGNKHLKLTGSAELPSGVSSANDIFLLKTKNPENPRETMNFAELVMQTVRKTLSPQVIQHNSNPRNRFNQYI